MKALLKIKFVLLLSCFVFASGAIKAQDAASESVQSHAPVPGQPLLQVNEGNLGEGVVTDISVTEFESMTVERKQFVKANPDRFRLLDAGTVEVARPQGNEELGLEPNQGAPEKYKLSKEELRTVSPEKLEYMKAHPQMYDLTELDQQ